MAHIASTSNFKLRLRQPLICVPSQSKSHTSTTPSLIKSSKPPNSSKCISTLKCSTPKNRTPIVCKYVGSSPNPEPESKSHSHKIWWSNVEVKRPRNVFSERKWSSLDKELLSVIVALHVLALFAPFTFSWGAFWVTVGLTYVIGIFGLGISYHRHLSHKSFKLPKWLEYFCAYCGVLALQRDPIYWVSRHRYHHQFTDTVQDPHSPIEGFWFSHINWLFDNRAIFEKCGKPDNVRDLESQYFYRFIQKTYYLHSLLLGVLLYAFGGFPYLVWGMGVRAIWALHLTWSVNSICHVWGKRAWNSGDLSRNNWWVALLTFGEGWHNNHHAFEYSARHGLEWWQIDMTWYTIKLLQLVGLATDVKLPTEEHKRRMVYESEGVAT